VLNQVMRKRGLNMPKYELKDLVGKRFGRLVVIRRVDNDKHYNTMWLCKCDCGEEKIIAADSLSRGLTKSCGCLNKENNSHPLKPGLANMRNVINSYKHNAKTRGLNWELTEEEFEELAQQNCHYCGAKPNNVLNRKDCNGAYTYNGIDRIDNSKGYTVDNVVPCCKRCNNAKRNYTLKEFKDWIREIHNRFKGDDKNSKI